MTTTRGPRKAVTRWRPLVLLLTFAIFAVTLLLVALRGRAVKSPTVNQGEQPTLPAGSVSLASDGTRVVVVPFPDAITRAS